MFGILKKIRYHHQWDVKHHDLTWYPSDKSCVRRNMDHVRPHQLPPLMVRKAAWRK